MPDKSENSNLTNIISKQSNCNTVYKSDRCLIDLMYFMLCSTDSPGIMDRKYLNVMHSHSMFEFHFVLQGSIEISLESGKKITVEKNHFILIPPSLKHSIIKESQDFRKILMTFELEALAGDSDEFYNYALRIMKNPIPYKASARMSKLFNVILDIKRNELHDKNSMLFDLIVCYIKEMCNVIVKKKNIKKDEITSDNRVEAAIRYIKNNISSPITTADVANALFISTKQLSRIFRENLGQTPAKYIRMSKNEYICKLLAETNLTLSDIAELVGSPDSAALIKRFKRIEGNTPIKYKQSINRKNKEKS